MARDLLADGADRRGTGAALAPYRADAPARHRLREWPGGHAAHRPVGAASRERGQQRDTDTAGDHLPQRLDARGAEVLLLAHAAARADGQGLGAQAMSVLEQQQRFLVE